jgi:hypothetical protein
MIGNSSSSVLVVVVGVVSLLAGLAVVVDIGAVVGAAIEVGAGAHLHLLLLLLLLHRSRRDVESVM